MPTTTLQLRQQLISFSLFPKTSLAQAIKRLGFVQADPIRCPARCQDLILRHRVKDYKAGDLENAYPKLDLEEDYTFAYGFLPKANRDLLHPRPKYTFSAFEKRVIDTVKKHGPCHPDHLGEHCGNHSTENAWGGKSKATKNALEEAHHFGALRIARRENGIRIYESNPPTKQTLRQNKRFEKLLSLTANLFGPTSPRFLLAETGGFRHLIPTASDRKKALNELSERGTFTRFAIDDIEYLAPKSWGETTEIPSAVKFLAPFDPIVRDRNRFEHLWDWAYRFEAYVPAAKRVRGYYALPILWHDDIVGWANAKVDEKKILNVEIGYERKGLKRHKPFQAALEKEVSELANFLHLDAGSWRVSNI